MQKPTKQDLNRALELACRMILIADRKFLPFEDLDYKPAVLVNNMIDQIRREKAETEAWLKDQAAKKEARG